MRRRWWTWLDRFGYALLGAAGALWTPNPEWSRYDSIACIALAFVLCCVSRAMLAKE